MYVPLIRRVDNVITDKFIPIFMYIRVANLFEHHRMTYCLTHRSTLCRISFLLWLFTLAFIRLIKSKIHFHLFALTREFLTCNILSASISTRTGATLCLLRERDYGFSFVVRLSKSVRYEELLFNQLEIDFVFRCRTEISSTENVRKIWNRERERKMC